MKGMISIPLYIPQILFNWNFGNEVCAFWLLMDYLLCTASVYNIVLISYDRYQSVSNAVSYRTRHTGILRIVAMMVGVWVLAFLVYGPVILVSESWKDGKENCEPGFLSEWYILAITSFLEFLVPVFSVAYFNVYIYYNLWKRGHLSRLQRYPRHIAASSSNSELSSSLARTALPEPGKAAKSCHTKRPGRKNSFLLSVRNQINSSVVASKMSSLHHLDSVNFQRERLELLKARKLARSLAILLGVFTFCWAPYSLFTIIRSISGLAQHPKSIGYEITFWLQWFNSFVNPFLYPLCHKNFQKAFFKIFCIKKQAVPSHSPSSSS